MVFLYPQLDKNSSDSTNACPTYPSMNLMAIFPSVVGSFITWAHTSKIVIIIIIIIINEVRWASPRTVRAHSA